MIRHFNGDTVQFESFYEILEEEIESSDLSVQCSSCNKVIVDEFRIIEHDNMKNFFCCPICEKIYCDLNEIEKSENKNH